MSADREVAARMTTEPKRGQLRIWHIPQVPGKAFHVPVESVREGGDILEVLVSYDIFQYENHIKPDYTNAQGMEVFDPESIGELGNEDGWIEWLSTDGRDICEHMDQGDDLDTLVWELDQ